MLKIRLTRLGKKNNAFFRLVVAEHTAPIKGRFIEAVGFINPHAKEKKLEKERILHWIEKGAKCSDTAHNLLVREGILKGPKKAVKMKKKAEEKKEESPKNDAEKSNAEKVETEEKPKDAVEEKKKEETKGDEKPEIAEAETPKKEEKAEKEAEDKTPDAKKEEAA